MRDTRSARIELHPAGVVIVRVLNVAQRVEDAQENVAVSLELAGGSCKMPLLVDITKSAPLVSEVRHYYVGGTLSENFTALGLLVEASPMGRMMGNVFFRMIEAANGGRGDVGPTQVFEVEEQAIDWLTSRRR